MRALPLLAVLSLPAPALADDLFVEVAGGIMMPVEDDDWTDYVDSGPKLAARVGTGGTGLGGMLWVDWTPVNVDNDGFQLPGVDVDIAAHRFRILVGPNMHQRVGKRLTASVRLGGGIDIARVSSETTVFGTTTEESDSDSGIAIEAAGGLWFDVGNMQIGGELGLPLSFHSDDADDDIDLEDYSSFDIDLMFGVRFLSR